MRESYASIVRIVLRLDNGEYVLVNESSKSQPEDPWHRNGELNFPGGKQHFGESLAATGAREWEEEVGIPFPRGQLCPIGIVEMMPCLENGNRHRNTFVFQFSLQQQDISFKEHVKRATLHQLIRSDNLEPNARAIVELLTAHRYKWHIPIIEAKCGKGRSEAA